MNQSTPLGRRGFLAAGAAAAGTLAAPGILRAQTVQLRLHHFNSPLSIAHTRFLVPWAERLAEETDGALQVEVFPAMQLGGKPSDLYGQAKDGIVDMVWTIPGYTANRFTLTEVFELPFVAEAAEYTAPAVQEFARRHFDEEYGDTHPILFHTHAPGHLHTSGTGVRTLEDMQGLQLRGPSRPITAALAEMGAVPVGMPVPAVTEAIARGVVDGAALPWSITKPIRLHEVTDHHTVVGFYALVFGMVMNQRRWNDLPGELQQAITASASDDFVRELGVLWDEDETAGYDLAVEAGNEIIELPEDERQRWKAASQPVIDAWIAKVDSMGMDGQALYDEALSLIAQQKA